MQLSKQQCNQLSLIALNAVKLAGDYIKQVNKSQLQTHFKDSGSSLSSQVVTEVDLKSQSIIIEQLAPSCNEYDIALLSEENCADVKISQHPRLSKDYFWCIDPLDGTLPFIEGRSGYAVSIALVNKKGLPVLSAIYLPATGTAYHTKFNKHGDTLVFKNGTIFSTGDNKPAQKIRFYCDQSFLNSQDYSPLINQLTALLKPFNLEKLEVISEHGAVVNALLTLENSPAFYLKLPKQQQGGGALWDFSGTACITHAVNGWVSDAKGKQLTLNQAESYYMNQHGVLYCTHQKLATELIAICNSLRKINV